MNPGDAVARPDGIAQAPDGSLYIGDSQRGKIWRVRLHRRAIVAPLRSVTAATSYLLTDRP